MHVDLRKQGHVLFFVVLLPAISLGLGWLSSRLVPNAPFWMETLSPLAAYGLLFALFDKLIWHWPVFRWIGVVTCPDVRGRWLGEQISSALDDQGKNRKSRVIMEISQTFSQLHIQTYYHKWQSSVNAAQFLPINNTPTLVIMFDSEPKVDYNGNSAAHRGVSKLTQLPDKTLVGSYFNANGYHGELKFRRTGYTLHQTFDSIPNNT